MRRAFLAPALAAAMLIRPHPAPAKEGAGTRPNVVIVLADDMGYGDPRCYNDRSRIPTPHIDRVAAAGMRFTDAHAAAAVCTPSRYALLTGRFCWRSRLKRSVLFNYEPPLIEPSRLTLGSLSKRAGYRTACIGKWHLGLGFSARKGQSFDFQRPLPWPGGTMPREEESKIDLRRPITGGPNELGFDLFYGTACCSTCNAPYGLIVNDRFPDPPVEYYRGKYLEQRSGYRSPSWDDSQADVLFCRRAQAFIRSAAAAGEPFLLYLATSAPHEPCEPEVIPEFIRGASKAGPRGDMVALVDWVVGEISGTLEKAGVAGDTILVVTSDNGAKPGSYNRFTYGHRSCGDLRGFKGSIWEGGHRVPLIVRWPGRVRAGSVSDQLVGLQDILATLAEILDIDLPPDAGEDSVSFLPALLGADSTGIARRDLIHHSLTGVFAMRRGPWKLIIDCDNSGDVGRGVHGNRGTGPRPGMRGQLYNLHDDPFELYNLVGREPQPAVELRALCERYRREGRSAGLARSPGDRGFVPIFDGESLEGWTVVPAKKRGDWTVRDGVITGTGTGGMSYLMWRDTDLTDFELRLRYRLRTEGNTGVEIRSRIDDTGRRPLQGYHADLGHPGIGDHILGVWDLHFGGRKEFTMRRGQRLVIDRQEKPHRSRIPGAVTLADIRARGWNDLDIVARGRRFRFWINGRPAAELIDDAAEGRLESGAVALQLHDPGMVVEFREIRLKRLVPAGRSRNTEKTEKAR